MISQKHFFVVDVVDLLLLFEAHEDIFFFALIVAYFLYWCHLFLLFIWLQRLFFHRVQHWFLNNRKLSACVRVSCGFPSEQRLLVIFDFSGRGWRWTLKSTHIVFTLVFLDSVRLEMVESLLNFCPGYVCFKFVFAFHVYDLSLCK